MPKLGKYVYLEQTDPKLRI